MVVLRYDVARSIMSGLFKFMGEVALVRTSKQRDRLWANLKRTWRYVRPCGWNLVGYAVVSIAEGMLGIFTQILSAKVILNLTGNMMG